MGNQYRREQRAGRIARAGPSSGPLAGEAGHPPRSEHKIRPIRGTGVPFRIGSLSMRGAWPCSWLHWVWRPRARVDARLPGMPVIAGGFVRPPPVAVSATGLQRPAALSRFRLLRFEVLGSRFDVRGSMWGHAVLRSAGVPGGAVLSPLLRRWGRAPGFSVRTGYPGTGPMKRAEARRTNGAWGCRGSTGEGLRRRVGSGVRR